jgi:hypothetical protein
VIEQRVLDQRGSSCEQAGDPAGRIEAAGAKALSEREAVPLGPDIIHSVINPVSRLTGALHVYGGDFFSVSHSQMGAGAACRGALRCQSVASAVRGVEPPTSVGVMRDTRNGTLTYERDGHRVGSHLGRQSRLLA